MVGLKSRVLGKPDFAEMNSEEFRYEGKDKSLELVKINLINKIVVLISNLTAKEC